MIKVRQNDNHTTRLTKLIHERLGPDRCEAVAAFAIRYFKHVPEADLLGWDLDDLYGALLSHWNFGQRRTPGTARVRTYNPCIEEQGWQSSHSIIEIVVEDMPFLVQSVIMAANRHGLTNHLVIHPVFDVIRTKSGNFKALAKPEQKGAVAEAYIHVEVDRESDPEVLDRLTANIQRVLTDVRAASEDWNASLERLQAARAALAHCPPTVAPAQARDAAAFLQWLYEDHFVFLAYREYDLVADGNRQGLRVVPGSGLGILRDSLAPIPASQLIPLSADAAAIISNPEPLMITKATTQSTVHRGVFMDYVGAKRYDEAGRVVGEMRFLGLYSSSAYHCSLHDTPLVNNKVVRVIAASGFAPTSHSGRALLHVLEDLPRDELYHSSENDILACAVGVLQLQERQRVRVFLRHDVYGQFVSALVFVPRERYHTDARRKMQAILLKEFDGKSCEFKVQLSESVLARIHFIIHTKACCAFDFNTHRVEQKIGEAFYDWTDGLCDTLLAHFGEERGNELFSRYGEGFSAAYREDFNPRNSIVDLERIEALSDDNFEIMLYQPLEREENRLRFKIYCRGQAVPLSHSLPMLENMGVRGLDERPYQVQRQDTGESYWIHDFGLAYDGLDTVDVDAVKEKFQEAFRCIWFGQLENDGFNRLVLNGNLAWRQIAVLRAYYFYMRQIGMTFSQNYVEQTLADNATVASQLVRLFERRFQPQPAEPDASDEKVLIKEIEAGIDRVISLDEDRILRRYLNLIQATVRTNFYQQRQDNHGVPYLSFKFDPARIRELPSPRPCHEIFVYSPRVEGVHLRGGPVARGGLRWSDRREDFRTEILGLMKAQIPKNAVIVPTGAKGGFVIKGSIDTLSRACAREELVDCYRIFVRGLLDITDNRSPSGVVKPRDVVCYDSDDSYLVVAADKGTAAFSDIANEVAAEYSFWLGDAFASGGSAGYDHKKMGITARGAWESIKHHFRELGLDIEQSGFSVIGIGDMSGDVFGNGLLMSDRIRLLGAFNHEHVFLDPDPDPEKSLAERRRLFQLPRSSWSDYDPSLISKGGGVYPRTAKSIAVSPEVRAMLAIESNRLTPTEMIRCLLKAPVDLLWNGGIGTYVKACDESNLEVGDRGNDALRINGRELQCKVVGEGGNLGFTQRGRIEYASIGGRINTDALDNSAGVDCSDHEVNIKILLGRIVAEGDMTVKQRNRLLESMSDEVAELVLRNNYLQTRAISMIASQACQLPGLYRRAIDLLEQSGRLDRTLECIPSDEALLARQAEGQCLFRPEIAVLMAYCKITLKDRLLENGDELGLDLGERELGGYFPPTLHERLAYEFTQHPLAREIIANRLVNALVNRVGIAFPFRMMDETGASVGHIVSGFRLACAIFDVPGLWRDIEALDTTVAPEIQDEMMAEVRKLVERTMFWLQRNTSSATDAEQILAAYRPAVVELVEALLKMLPEKERGRACQGVERLIGAGVPQRLATQIMCLRGWFACLDIITVHQHGDGQLLEVAAIYFQLDKRLAFSWLRSQISALPRDSFWQSLARTALRDDLHAACRLLTHDVLMQADIAVDARVGAWLGHNRSAIERYEFLLQAVQDATKVELEKMTVVLKELHGLSTSCEGMAQHRPAATLISPH